MYQQGIFESSPVYRRDSRDLGNPCKAQLDVLDRQGLCEAQDQLAAQMGARRFFFISSKDNIVIVQSDQSVSTVLTVVTVGGSVLVPNIEKLCTATASRPTQEAEGHWLWS